MKRLYFQHMILSGTLIFALGACSHKPPKVMKADMSVQTPSSPPQHVVLLQEARVEAEHLRAELASLKILMAKQAGELQALQGQSKSVQHRERDQGRELQEIRSELLASQAERDQLRTHNMELENQVSSIPDTSQLVSNIQGLHSSFQQIMGSIKGLASDMRLIKQEMHITTKKAAPQQTKMTTTLSGQASPAKPTPDGHGRIIIQEGDTLWQLARTYQVSVEQLTEWNQLSSDLIMTGLSLQVVEPIQTVEHLTEQEDSAIPVSLSTYPEEETVDMAEPQISEQRPETPLPHSSEPTHILSIGSPQSETHESP